MMKSVLRVLRKDGVGGVIRRGLYWISRWMRCVPGTLWLRGWLKNLSFRLPREGPLRLQLGCGSKELEGYVNCDLEDWAGVCDFVSPAIRLNPIPSNSVDELFHHAMIEHMPPWETLPALHEWFRVLKPGGIILIETPDLERIFNDWLVEGKLAEQDAIDNIFGGNKSPDKSYSAQHHLTGFTYAILTRLMEEVGFEELQRFEHHTYHHLLCVKGRKPLPAC